MKHLKTILPVAAFVLLIGAAPAYAHGFGERTELPVPLGYFLLGSGAVVALSFAVMGLFVRGTKGSGSYWRYDLLRHGWLRWVLTGPLPGVPVKMLSVFLLIVVIVTGLFGDQTPSANFAPSFVWIIWWVGMAYVAALIGNVWAVINPWKILFGWWEWLYGKLRHGSQPAPVREYPEEWGMWPALVLFLAFAWLQDAFPRSSVPALVAWMAIIYSGITFTGMAIFGKRQWLRNGEVFSVVFGFLARFSLTEVRVSDPEVCRVCTSGCRGPAQALDASEWDGCVDCYECFEKSSNRQINLRPFAMGLSRNEPVSNDVLAVVVLLLATVTFDGFGATSAWANVQSVFLTAFPALVGNPVVNGLTIADTLGVLLFPVAFFLVYLLFCFFMAGMVRESGPPHTSRPGSVGQGPAPAGKSLGAMELARAFAYSLIPIALAYNISHFITLLLVQGQLIINLASDPFGFGWDLFGTADYQVYQDIITAEILWFLSVAVVVVGHVIAVYLAHLASMRIFQDRSMAMNSQYPMLTLMVMYTVVSLWILAQPIAA